MNTQKMPFSTFVLLLIISVLLLGARTSNGAAGPTPDCGSWHIVSSPNLTRSDNLAAVKVLSSNDIWAVGQAYKTTHSTISQTLTEHWNGMQWSIVANPVLHASSSLLAVTAISNTDVWAVGATGTRTLTEHWNGSSWLEVSSPSTGQSDVLEGVQALSSHNVWAVGVANGNNGSRTLIEHWNGSSWAIVASPNQGNGDDLHAITSLAPNNIWTVGDNDTSIALIEHWNGSNWTIVPTPSIGTYARLSSVSALAANNIWAAGYTDTTGGYKTLVEHWNGISWSILPSPNQGSYNDMLTAISTVSAKNIWAVGWYRNPTHAFSIRPYMLHWDGKTWHVIQTPDPGSYVYFLVGLAHIPGNGMTWAVGYWQYHNIATIKTLTELYC